MYIQQALKGGKTQSSENKMYHIEKETVYVDACSLYSASGYRLNQDYEGIPCGEYKKFEGINEFNDLKNKEKCYYIATIKVKSLEDKQQMCFFDYKDETGKRIYDANYEAFLKANNGNEITIDRTQLEDYVRYHKMDFEFVEGIYWSDSDPRYGDLCLFIFNERKKFKALRNPYGNALQQVCKLILNSSYGKLGQKPSEEKIVFKNKQT